MLGQKLFDIFESDLFDTLLGPVAWVLEWRTGKEQLFEIDAGDIVVVIFFLAR